ncbi:hypothetical protein F5B21DRAFT_458773 [Xylaria acuta]|nr:hypothetical protein F5B21DRAFT_458773 [Xylaria acuta]
MADRRSMPATYLSSSTITSSMSGGFLADHRCTGQTVLNSVASVLTAAAALATTLSGSFVNTSSAFTSARRNATISLRFAGSASFCVVVARLYISRYVVWLSPNTIASAPMASAPSWTLGSHMPIASMAPRLSIAGNVPEPQGSFRQAPPGTATLGVSYR